MLHYIAITSPIPHKARYWATQIAKRYGRKLGLENSVRTQPPLTTDSLPFSEWNLVAQAHRLLDDATILRRAYREGGAWVFDFSLDARMEVYIKAMRKMNALSAEDYLLLAKIYGEIKLNPSARTPDIIVCVWPDDIPPRRFEADMPTITLPRAKQDGLIRDLYERFVETCKTEYRVTVVDFTIHPDEASWGVLDELVEHSMLCALQNAEL